MWVDVGGVLMDALTHTLLCVFVWRPLWCVLCVQIMGVTYSAMSELVDDSVLPAVKDALRRITVESVRALDGSGDGEGEGEGEDTSASPPPPPAPRDPAPACTT